MRNEHPDFCYRCGEWCETKDGHFERWNGAWRVQHASCAVYYRGTSRCCITSFSGPYRWLSNFHPSIVQLDGQLYETVEHAYQAAKTDDPALRRFIFQCPTPGAAKKAGRNIELRPDWDDRKVEVMAQLLLQKFHPGTWHAERLEATEDHPIIEGNTWGDTFWGKCRGEGSNVLGQLIMKIREDNRR